MTSSAVNNVAAIAAALHGADDKVYGVSLQANRRSLTLKHGGGNQGIEVTRIADSAGSTGHPSEGFYGQDGAPTVGKGLSRDESAVADGLLEDGSRSMSRARLRRASEGALLSKHESKRASSELKCEKCGKGYKHSSCLTKHLWEHTPEWTYTSKLLISKHQQVQLLEAASVLMGLNQDEPSDSPKTTDSDQSSASPAASGYSELQEDEDISSAETTPPPMGDQREQPCIPQTFNSGIAKRHSGNSSAFSRSYQSAPSSSFLTGSVPLNSLSSGQQYQTSRRPSTSGIASSNHPMLDEEEAGLAAAVESLCSFGTPRSGPVHLPPDVPPVPPLPARFTRQNLDRLSGNMVAQIPQLGFGLPLQTHRLSNEREMITKEHGNSTVDDEDDFDERSLSHGRSDEDDDGVFGRMEE